MPGESTLSKALDEIIDEKLMKTNYLRTKIQAKTNEINELLIEMNDRLIELQYFEEKRKSLEPVSLSACKLTGGLN